MRAYTDGKPGTAQDAKLPAPGARFAVKLSIDPFKPTPAKSAHGGALAHPRHGAGKLMGLSKARHLVPQLARALACTPLTPPSGMLGLDAQSAIDA
jgi:hypothetical protein